MASKPNNPQNSLVTREPLPADVIERLPARELFTDLEVRLIELVADGETPREAARALGIKPLAALEFLHRPDAQMALQLERDALTLGTHSALANKAITHILGLDWDEAGLAQANASVRAKTAVEVLKLARSITSEAPRASDPASLEGFTAAELEAYVNEKRRIIDVQVTELAREEAPAGVVPPDGDLF